MFYNLIKSIITSYYQSKTKENRSRNQKRNKYEISKCKDGVEGNLPINYIVHRVGFSSTRTPSNKINDVELLGDQLIQERNFPLQIRHTYNGQKSNEILSSKRRVHSARNSGLELGTLYSNTNPIEEDDTFSEPENSYIHKRTEGQQCMLLKYSSQKAPSKTKRSNENTSPTPGISCNQTIRNPINQINQQKPSGAGVLQFATIKVKVQQKHRLKSNNDEISLSIKATSQPLFEFASLTCQVAQTERLISFQKDIGAVLLQTTAIEARVHQKRLLKSSNDIECIKLRSLYNESLQNQTKRRENSSIDRGQRVNKIKTIDNSVNSNLLKVDREFLNSTSSNDNLSLKTHYIWNSWLDVLPSTKVERTWALSLK